MRPDDLIDVVPEAITREDFPDELAVGNSKLPLEYRFEPGSDRDGVNVRVHQSALSQISDDSLGWLVPGLLEQKLVAMIKSLPKRIRRNLVPAADVASRIAQQLSGDYGTAPFMSVVCKAMSQHAEMPIGPDDFQQDKLDDHFRFLVTVVDDDGAVVAEDREVELLRQHAGAPSPDAAETATASDDEDWFREAIKTFEMDRLPREVIRLRGGVQVAQYPGLVDQGDAVSTQLFSDESAANASLRKGLMRLYAIARRKELRAEVRHLPALEQAKIQLSGVVSASRIDNALVDLLARIAFVDQMQLIRSRDEFETRLQEHPQRIAQASQQVAPWLAGFGEHYFAVRRELESLGNSSRFADAIRDVRYQLQWLLFDGFLSATPWQWLKHYPRYLSAIAYRLDKLRSGAGSRDEQSMQVVAQLWQRWLNGLIDAERQPDQQTESEFRWMIEELRVSLFAQPLGTAVKVSPQRCEKLLP